MRDDGTVGLNVGGWYVGADRETISTVLGSCVAVCLYDPEVMVGGMNHILLPGDYDMKRITDAARYGVNAMEVLINGMMKFGCQRKRLLAKAFGGAALLAALSEMFGMGSRNVAFVRDFLAAEKIPLIRSDFGGDRARIVLLDTSSNEVFLKRIQPMYQRKVSIAEERNCLLYRRKLSEEETQVDLFVSDPLDKGIEPCYNGRKR